ncbi:MAG: clostripain-related cysteine peptidase [Chloroflexota bacterium]
MMNKNNWQPRFHLPLKHLTIAVVLGGALLALLVLVPAVSMAQTGDEAPQKTGTPLPPPDPLDMKINQPINRRALSDIASQSPGDMLGVPKAQAKLRVQLGDHIEVPETEKSANSSKRVNEAQKSKPPAPDSVSPNQRANRQTVDQALSSEGWVLRGGEDFERDFGPNVSGLQCDYDRSLTNAPNWFILDQGEEGFERTWGEDSFAAYSGNYAAWPAAGGNDGLDGSQFLYPNNLNSWMICGPFDFSTAATVLVEYNMWLKTELNYDWLMLGASTDGTNYDLIDFWSGNSEGWLFTPYELESYAGQSEVWLAWVFQSDERNHDDGVWIDNIEIWAYEPPVPDPSGQFIQDGGFENDGEGWLVFTGVPSARKQAQLSPQDAQITTDTAVEGNKSVVLFGDGDLDDFLYQQVDIPDGIEKIDLNFWFGVTTNETEPDVDWVCVSLANEDFSQLIVDLGCMDAVFTTGAWQEVGYALTEEEIEQAIDAETVNLVFELYNRGTVNSGTSLWIDAVQLYGTNNSTAIDTNEVNDDVDLAANIDEATPISCGSTTKAVIGDVLESYDDVDWYKVSNVPTGRLVVDINAESLSPPSELDSVVSLYRKDGTSLTFIDENDDDGATYDSYISYTVQSANETFYILVESYDGYGDSESYYDLFVDCASSSTPPQPESSTAGQADTWTVMLYLNAEDPNFEKTLQKYITDMETVIAGKTDFLTVTVLYDGPKHGDTVRYVLQPSGVYTDGLNRWKLTELNVGDRDTLAGFLEWSMDNYPAENFYAAIDDHGHGVYGISWDLTNNNDELTPPEVYSALKEATNNGQRKIDIIDSEACLMGMAEHAYDVNTWVDYIVFSEQINWELNTYPNYFSSLQASDTPVQLGTHIVNTVHTLANNDGRPHTISLVDTSKMDQVKAAITLLGDALKTPAAGQTEAQRRTAVDGTRNKSQAFAGDNDATNPLWADYIDLWDLADKASTDGLITANLAQTVKDAVEEAVLVEHHANGLVDNKYTWNHDGAHGMSVYFPAGNASSAFQNYTQGRLFNMTSDDDGIQGHWDEFLLWAVTSAGNGTGNGIGGEGRKPMRGARFLFAKKSNTQVYIPLILK